MEGRNANEENSVKLRHWNGFVAIDRRKFELIINFQRFPQDLRGVESRAFHSATAPQRPSRGGVRKPHGTFETKSCLAKWRTSRKLMSIPPEFSGSMARRDVLDSDIHFP